MIGSDTMVDAIKQATDDKSIKAIVLRVDSPGGSALASDLIWHAIENAKEKNRSSYRCPTSLRLAAIT